MFLGNSGQFTLLSSPLQSVVNTPHRVINAELRQPKSTLGAESVFDSLVDANHSTQPSLRFLDRTFNRTLATTLVKTIQTLVTYTSSERGRSVVPPITDAAGISPFPYTVVVKIGNQEVG
jgi:hypothetical protein